MVELFAEKESFEYFETLKVRLRNEISSLPDEKIIGMDIVEWTDYYFEKWKIQPISLFLENITQSLSETTIEEFEHGYRTNQYEKPKICYEGYKITFDIPYDGNNDLLYITPSTRYTSVFRVDDIKKGNASTYDSIVISLTYKKQDLVDKETPEFIKSQFSSTFRYYTETIDNINKDLKQYNEALSYIIKNALEARKKKAVDFVILGEKLSIPLNISSNAPNTVPILLKKNILKKPEMPNTRQVTKEYAIESSVYENINNIIRLAGISMEKTAKTFIKLEEEELRDVILSNLNTHYQGTATGETFSKTGKSDIYLQFENKAAYIAECKVWHGEKNLKDALEQLFGYLTWRDVKTSVIIFNKENKDFQKLLESIKTFFDKSELCNKVIPLNKNEWQCEFKKSIGNTEIITVHVIVFDLFVL